MTSLNPNASNEQVSTTAISTTKNESQNNSDAEVSEHSHRVSSGKPKYEPEWRRTPWTAKGERSERPYNRSGPERYMFERLGQLAGPSYEIAALENEDKKFSGRTRLYIGNVPPKTTEQEIKNLFQPFGETVELFLNKDKNFGFIKLDYRYNAEKAKCSLNGFVMKGKVLKVRFAPNGSTIKVKNLDEHVTNELLSAAFSIFGDIDRCVVVVDDKGKPTGEGIVEFSRKSSAQFALQKCADACFFLTASLRPVVLENYEILDEYDGLSEKSLTRKGPDFFNNRSVGPRFAPPDSFELQSGMLWKQLYELHGQRETALKKDFEANQNKLKAQIELARYEHETAMLREQLRNREVRMEKQKREWEVKEQQAEEARKSGEERMKRQEKEMSTFMLQREDEMRRIQQENNLFEQAYQLDNMLNVVEQNYDNYYNYNEADNGYASNEARGYTTIDTRNNNYPKRRRLQPASYTNNNN